MFDLGFIADVRFILRRLPERTRRQCLLFSATLSHRVLELAYEHMNEAEKLTVETEFVTADRVRQLIYFPASEEKIPLLIGLLSRTDAKRSMIFVNMKVAAEKVSRRLERQGFLVGMLSGDVPQKKRQSLLGKFQRGEIEVLIATDVAARGLHIGRQPCSITTCRRMPETTCTASAAPRASAPTAMRSVLTCDMYAQGLPDIEALSSARRFRSNASSRVAMAHRRRAYLRALPGQHEEKTTVRSRPHRRRSSARAHGHHSLRPRPTPHARAPPSRARSRASASAGDRGRGAVRPRQRKKHQPTRQSRRRRGQGGAPDRGAAERRQAANASGEPRPAGHRPGRDAGSKDRAPPNSSRVFRRLAPVQALIFAGACLAVGIDLLQCAPVQSAASPRMLNPLTHADHERLSRFAAARGCPRHAAARCCVCGARASVVAGAAA
jgi:ATP-dependent RNA helicase RhlB